MYPNQLAKQAAERLDRRGVQLWLTVCLFFALVFLIVRGLEFTALNVRWDTDAYGSVVWLLLELHTTHLVTDTWDTTVLDVLFFTGPLEGKRYVDVSENADVLVFRRPQLAADLRGRLPRAARLNVAMLSWPALLIAPLVALSQLSIAFSLVGPACEGQNRTVLHAISAVSVLLVVVLTAMAWQGWRQHVRSAVAGDAALPAVTRGDLDSDGHRPHFVALIGLVVGALSLLVCAALWVPVWMLSPCY